MSDPGCGCGGVSFGGPGARGTAGGPGTPDARVPSTANPPGQRVLHRRAAVHASALARMRAELGAPDRPLEFRSLARHTADDPVIALLDAWAIVADVVAFYTERIATEGFLRTATERLSVRELARTLGYELRPGVAAQAYLAFTAETAEGAPETVPIPQGTPIQSIPGAGELPQVFETGQEVQARGAWNSIRAVAAQRQTLGSGADAVWLRGINAGVERGDRVLIVGAERRSVGPDAAHGPNHEKWDFRTVAGLAVSPDQAHGWTRLDLDRPLGDGQGLDVTAVDDVRVHLLTERVNLFGWNAPDPNLLAGKPADSTGDPPNRVWTGYAIAKGTDVVELEGDRRQLMTGSWIVLEQPDSTEAFEVKTVQPGGATKFGISGKLTRVTVAISKNLDRFTRPAALVHAVSKELPAREMPVFGPVGGGFTLDVEATTPPLPPRRVVLVRGREFTTGAAVSEPMTVLACTLSPDATTMTLTFDARLRHSYHAQTVTVAANVAVGSHGESVRQTLGSGDGRQAFAQFGLRRAPLTYLRTTTAEGASAELSVRVDGVQWAQVPSLDTAGPNSRAYVVRQDEGGQTRIVFGDGIHGARPPTGAENIEAGYRVGIGAAGAMKADQLRLPMRRPPGIRDVTNPGPAQDWAPEETLEDARVNAPLRVRTLDRAVSVQDHEDFARGFAGVGATRADLVWNGHAHFVVVSVLGVGARVPGGNLLADLGATLTQARDPGTTQLLKAGELLWFGVRVEVDHDPAYGLAAVHSAVRNSLASALSPSVRAFAAPVSAAEVLLLVHSVPGVVACTMPRLFALPDPPSPDPALPPVLPPGPEGASPRTDLLGALPARWDDSRPDPDGKILPAQLLGLAPGAVEIGVMTP